MPIIFDGRVFAEEKIKKLDKEVAKLKNRGIHPKLASILVGDDPASRLYVSLKKKAAERVGIELEIIDSIDEISRLNKDEDVHGIMIQMPLPGELAGRTKEIINSIAPHKDVDGLREDSPFVHPTAMAVLQTIKEAIKQLKIDNLQFTICVVGSAGMVGGAFLKEIKKTNYQLVEKSEEADILVSTTGSPNIIKAKMVKKGAIVIDVGSPKGDCDPEVSKVAGFITPVPGGIGPITIASLLENLVKASEAIV